MSSLRTKRPPWLDERENEHLEFKEAKSTFHFEKLVEYCAALANEGGGQMILGVTDQMPRKIVGTSAFTPPERTVAELVRRLRLKVRVEELILPEGRVLVFEVPPHPPGMPLDVEGAYLMRAGDELRPMTADQLRRIFDEIGPDYSAEICHKASLDDLDLPSVERFRSMWRRKSGNAVLDTLSPRQILRDTELLIEKKITYAALILFGTKTSLGKFLPQAEMVFEYRNARSSIPYQQRIEFREGFFNTLDQVWNAINLRNQILHYKQDFFVWDIPAFNEHVIREAILNALTHRDYRLAGSIFVRQYPDELEIVNPGGFLPGITAENILWRHTPRNRRIAEVCARCGLVERSGQGTNIMFEESIKEAKPVPDYSLSDQFQVSVILKGIVRDEQFLHFLSKIGPERLSKFSTQDFLTLDLLHQEQEVSSDLKQGLNRLLDEGIVERIGRGRGVRYILSRRFYSSIGKAGVYTRRRGLDRETNKSLLLSHIVENGNKGTRLAELLEVLPALSRGAVQTLLRDLKNEGRLQVTGRTKGGVWYPGSL
jgi:ATP-dependent DNA helicase RecG